MPLSMRFHAFVCRIGIISLLCTIVDTPSPFQFLVAAIECYTFVLMLVASTEEFSLSNL